MKKLLGLGFIAVSLIAVVLVSYNSKKQSITLPQAAPLGENENINLVKKVKVGDFSVIYSNFFDGDQVTLLPNFEKKEIARQLYNDNGCKVLVNAGFYSKENTPIGLFVSEHKEIGKFQTNRLFNGILSVNDMETPRITRNVPTDRLRLAVQTGPVLIENAQAQTLNINNDSPARRMVALVNGENKIAFLSVYDEESTFQGPKLADLPKILEDFEKETGIEIADAINLDGGTASALISNDYWVNEVSPIGSFFCIR